MDVNKNSGQQMSVSKQYLTFTLDDEVFACDVLRIKEVLELSKITKIPKTPSFMTGVINLRGGVVPVIDLKQKFEIGHIENTVNTSIIIVEITYEEQLILLGALVDSVKQVIKIDASELEPPPKIGMKFNGDFIEAIGKENDDFIMILNIEKVFSEEELNIMHTKSSLSTNSIEPAEVT